MAAAVAAAFAELPRNLRIDSQMIRVVYLLRLWKYIKIVSPRRSCVALFLILTCLDPAKAQVIPSTKPQQGLRETQQKVHPFIGATIISSPGEILEGAAVIGPDGLIEGVGAEMIIPSEAQIHDLTGHRIYAGFIDAYVMLGNPLLKSNNASARS